MNIKDNALLIIKTLLLLTTIAIIYWQDLILIANEALNSDISTHILIIPPLLTYIIYRIRNTLSATTSNNFITTHLNKKNLMEKIIGTLLCVIAYLVKWYGSYTFQPLEFHIASIPIFIAGFTLIIFNYYTFKSLIFPIAFLIFLIPPPLESAQKALDNGDLASLRRGQSLTRPASPEECEEFQTLPIGYTSCLLKGERFKCIGNGWTVDVVAHIFKGLLNENI